MRVMFTPSSAAISLQVKPSRNWAKNAEKALQKRRFDSRWGAERIRWTGQKIWFAGVTPWPVP
jgi:hypothetical protein